MEYKSEKTLLGLPLVHIKGSTYHEGQRKIGIARGWIAMGDIAISPFLALGGIALGTLSSGGLAAGLLSLGGLAIGGVAIGGAAFGLWAAGGLAVAFFVAIGGSAIAVECAFGGLAIAEYTNAPDPMPCIGGTFKWFAEWLARYSHWFALGLLLPILAAAASRRKREVK
jgi:hypothetical protein